MPADETYLACHTMGSLSSTNDVRFNHCCREKAEALGPDPLREDADPERLWSSIQTCKKPIGLVLMDQTLVAGLGNIYRAEVLFKVCLRHASESTHD